MKTTDKSKKKKLVYEGVPDERKLNALKDGTRLEWVPTWEGALQYAPEDLKADRCLRIWHTFRSRKFGGRRIRIELKVTSKAYKGCYSQRQRARFVFCHKGPLLHLYRSTLTMFGYNSITLTMSPVSSHAASPWAGSPLVTLRMSLICSCSVFISTSILLLCSFLIPLC